MKIDKIIMQRKNRLAKAHNHIISGDYVMAKAELRKVCYESGPMTSLERWELDQIIENWSIKR